MRYNALLRHHMSQYEMYNRFESLPLTLTMLGTKTIFTPTLKKTPKAPRTKGTRVADYPKGETLSVLSTLIQTETPAQTGDKNYAYQANEIVVINGPETKGSDVGEKIALGLAAALKAIARGQMTVNIIAHSRGAVESILIAHELQALQEIIKTSDNTQQLIKQLSEQQAKRQQGTPKNNTPDIIVVLEGQLNLIPKGEQAQWFSDLKTNIAQASINFFGIDPVPGDCFPITWYDERFFTLPKIIKNAQILYYENEHSDWGFTPICPEAESKEEQAFVRYSMPGHHGTGSSGNNASQLGVVVCENEVKATHVQKIIIYKMLDFLTEHGVKFNDEQQIFHKYTALGKKYSTVEVDAMHVSQFDFPTIYRELYAAIAKNRAAYEAYNKTNYPYMGLSLQRKILHNVRNERVYGVFNDVFPAHSGYVNDEHAALMRRYFFNIFGLDTNPNSLAEMINTAHSVLEENIKKIASERTPILGTEKARKDVLETFDKVVREVSSQYFTDDWSSVEKQEKKQALYQAIIDILAKFKELSTLDNEVIKQFVVELTALGLSGINLTIEYQHKDIEEDFNRLQESTDKRLITFFNGLLMQISQVENQSSIALEEAVHSEEYKKLANHPYADKITHISKKLDFRIYTIEQLTERFEEQYPDSIESFAKLYQQIQVFINDITALRRLTPTEKMDQIELSLHQKSNALIATAAERFYKDKPNALPPIAAPGTFMELVNCYAINNYDVVDRIQKKTTILELHKQNLIEQLKTLTNEKNTQAQQAQEQIAQLQQTLAQQVDALTCEKNIQVQQTQEQIAQLQQTLTQQVEALTREKNTQAQQAQTQIAQLQQTLTQQVEALTREKNIQAQQAQTQIAQLQQTLTQQVEALTCEKNIQAQQAQTQIAQLQQTLTQQVEALTCEKNIQAQQAQTQIAQLQQTLTQQVEALTCEKNTQTQQAQEQITQLEQQKQTLIKQLNQATTEKTTEELAKKDAEVKLNAALKKAAKNHEAMNKVLQAKNLLLISEELEPLTKAYLQNLHETKATTPQKTRKIEIVNDLLECLRDFTKNPSPKARVDAFYTKLNGAETELKIHCDPDWTRYVRNAVVIAGILLTGILPGLLALTAYRQIGNSALKSFSFWNSTGTNVYDALMSTPRPQEEPNVNAEPRAPNL